MDARSWLLCPICNGKTRCQIREDTILIRFPLYCPKCRTETLIEVRGGRTTILKEPDAETQSR